MIKKCLLPLFLFFLSASISYSQSLDGYLQFFSSVSSRMPGTEGHEKAADFIENKFKAAGLKRVAKEEFSVVVPVEEYAFLNAGGKRIELHCMWPNLVRTSTLPPAGLEGKLIYGGDGDLRKLEGRDIVGNIIVLDFDSEERWRTIAMLGARAFIFTDVGNVTRIQAEKKFVNVPIDVPRFYAHENSGEIINLAQEERTVRLFAKMTWRKVEDYNIVGYLEGRNRDLKEDLILIQSYYDSVSAVPAVSKGATSAAGISVLLDLLDYFNQNPPERTLVFLATSSHYQGLRGIDAFIQKHLRKDAHFRKRIPEEEIINPRLFIGLDLSDGSESLGLWHNSDDFYHQKLFAPYGRKFMVYSESVSKKLGYNPETSLVNGISPERGLVWQTFLPERIRTEGQYIISAGHPALSLVTVHDGRWRVDTPADTYGNLNVNNIARQSRFIKGLLSTAVNDPDFFPDVSFDLVKDNMGTLNARVVTFDPSKSFIPSDPVSGALVIPRVALSTTAVIIEKSNIGVRNTLIGMTDEEGKASFSNLSMRNNINLEAFYLDSETGDIKLAPDLGVGGAAQYPVRLVLDYKDKDWMIVLFNAKSINLFDLIDSQYLVQLDKVEVLDMANSLPGEYGYFLQYADFIPLRWTSYSEPVGCIFANPLMRFKVLGQAGPLGKRLLLLNAEESLDKEKVEGLGFHAGAISAIYETPYQGARDMIILDRYRRESFEQFGIRNERLAELQDESRMLMQMADAAKKDRNWYEFVKYSRQAQAVESRAYPDVRNTANDVVKGVIFYFMLLLPFAYFGERLLFSFARLEKRVAGIFGIFLVVYWIMRWVHPAFKLTNAPEVILLSFIVLALSLVVLSIVASKFEEQMRQLKMETSKVYETDVGRITATATAFSLGVANMKRRPIRTVLTAITLILLTFTVLSFTSIKSYMKYNQIARPYKPVYQGILLRDRAWSPLMGTALDYTENEFSGKGVIAPRSWFVLDALGNRTAVEIKHSNSTVLSSGLLGLSPREILPVKDALVKGAWFEDNSEESVLISRKMYSQLKLSDADIGSAHLWIYGKKFLLKGIFDEKILNDMKDIDDERITPTDFSVIPEREIAKMKMERTAQVFTTQTKMESFVHTEAENIAILPFRTLMNMKGTMHSVAVAFNKGEEGNSLVEGFISKLAVIVFAGLGDKTYIYSSMGLTSFAGISNLIIPILIAALIVLNTMLGSVYERIREIGTYSAVGLAPVHISSLFLAESLVYAVMGAVAGYLLGQVVAKILMATGLLKGLTLNYSSLSAVFATIIIFITVMLSTLYPARKAARMAVPDVTRKWILPEPKGDNWEFEFPFTVSEFEVLGLVTFLTEYYNSYQDVSLGNFYTGGAALSSRQLPSGKNKYVIDTMIWLAPFDLGVSQKLNVEMEPMGQFEFYTINLVMKRMSGESTDWKRLNRRFLDGIRKQFLIWRTVSGEVKKDYEKKGRKLLNTV
ncbi:MAG: FtsX-like permease family protein [Candidatus Omnitrophica bacterium]|nr:FtsX-like permease family protein [Candidatus Omnitrophota bacterium]